MTRYQFDVDRDNLKASSDPILVGTILLLVGLGLVTLYSASFAFSDRFFHDGLYFLKRQVAYAALGLLLFLLASRIRLDLIRRYIGPLVFGVLFLCLLTFLPGIGVSKNGASRWIHIGSSTYQPSELVKVALPIYLAHIFDKKKDRIDNFFSAVLPPTLVTVVFFLIIYFQNNFSTASFIMVNALVIFFLAGLKLRYFFAAALLTTPLSLLLVLTKEHRLLRLMTFISPEWDPLGAGYQVRSSILTIVSGGWWGKGIGQGTRKIASVPEIHSDFIFSAFAEEAGLIGVVLFFALFGVFTVRSFRAALRSDIIFHRLLACAMGTIIASQGLLNVAVVSGALPATGIPLPFFSAGGSSLATMLFSAGLIVNISRQSQKPEVFHV